jgi:hypothetical protein
MDSTCVMRPKKEKRKKKKGWKRHLCNALTVLLVIQLFQVLECVLIKAVH